MAPRALLGASVQPTTPDAVMCAGVTAVTAPAVDICTTFDDTLEDKAARRILIT
jgi:hypothetical protein